MDLDESVTAQDASGVEDQHKAEPSAFPGGPSARLGFTFHQEVALGAFFEAESVSEDVVLFQPGGRLTERHEDLLTGGDSVVQEEQQIGSAFRGCGGGTAQDEGEERDQAWPEQEAEGSEGVGGGTPEGATG